jgi:hypothetical protein
MVDVFFFVFAGHLLGDFVVQTDHQAADKEASWRANLAHVLTYHVTMSALVVPVWHDQRAATFLLISFVSHALVDKRMAYQARPRSHRQQGLLDGLLGDDRDGPGAASQHPRYSFYWLAT